MENLAQMNGNSENIFETSQSCLGIFLLESKSWLNTEYSQLTSGSFAWRVVY